MSVAFPVSTRKVGVLGPTWVLWQREVVRFLRQRNRVAGALLTPVVFWLLLGVGLNDVFVPGGAEAEAHGVTPWASGKPGYLAYFFPGSLVLIVLFTAIFSTISVIEDRRDGFLQGVLVSPAPRLSIVLGKVLGGATLATGQGLLFLLIAPLVLSFNGPIDLLLRLGLAVGAVFVLAVGLTAIGLCFALPMDSTAGFHAVMNLVLMPMWFLSGAVFPVATAGWLKPLMLLNPLTYGHAMLTGVLHGGAGGSGGGIDPVIGTVVWLAVTLGAVAFAVRLAGGNRP